MKLCPQCDFIYEDDQRLCDMDGADLVFDATPFPLAKNGAPNSAVMSSANSRAWRYAATVVVGVVLGAVLFLVSSHPASPQSSNEVANITPEQVVKDSTLAATDDSGAPPILDLAQPVPLTPSIDAPPAPAAAISGNSSPESQSPGPFQSTQLPELSESTAGENGRTSAAALSPSPARLPAPKREERKRKPARAGDKPKADHQKKDSSIGSFLKKTGRILKKPFKF
jgi:hypothetical protein